MTRDWTAQARSLTDHRHEAQPGWEVIRGERPVVLDGDGIRALLAPAVAVLAWTGAAFRELVAMTPLEPLGLLMRLVALAMTLRAIFLGRALWERLHAWWHARRCVLVLGPEGLWARLPEGEVSIERREILDVVERGTWQARAAGRRHSPVYVITSSPLRTHLALPPVFDATPGVLAERLMRWRGGHDAQDTPAFPAPAPLASKVYDDAAHGVRAEGTRVIRHGWAWLVRGPWATMLLAIAVLESYARAEPAARAALGPAFAGAVFLALITIPLLWVLMTRRSIAPRLGLAMVLTPAELLMRTGRGVLRTRWSDLQRATIDVRGHVSAIEGWAVHRAVVFKRREGGPITFDEAYLGVPAEVAVALCEAYVRGAMLAADSDAVDDGRQGPEAAFQGGAQPSRDRPGEERDG